MLRRTRALMADQRGFTIAELSVAMAMGLIVLFAAGTLMVVGLHDTGRVTDRIQATQQGRTATEQLVQELNSGCLANDVSPVQAQTATGISPVVKTDGSDLVFVSGLGNATGTPTEHVVTVKNGALIDISYANTGGLPPALNTAATWTFSSTPTVTRTLLAHVAQINASTPMFQYFSYSTTTPPMSTTPLSPTPLSAAAAASVAQVNIAWRVAPNDGLTDNSRIVQMNDSVAFRLTPASATGTNLPCD